MGAVIAVIAIVGCVLFCPRGGPPVDRTPPTLGLPCHPGFHVYADPRLDSTVVKWDDPTAQDPSNPVSVQRVDNNPNSGNRFSALNSPYIIRYSATDGKGNKNNDLCSFKITVTVRKCETHPSIPMGYVSCSRGNWYGSRCDISCIAGYSITGNRQRTCQSYQQWSGTRPACTPIKCQDPYPDLPDETTSCTDGYNYNSICFYTCQSGYSLIPGQTGIRVCQASSMWTGTPNPQCIDTQRPTITTPGTIMTYASANQIVAMVTWDQPIVMDNSNEIIGAQQIEGLPPGSDFSRGSHVIKYGASDSAGNTVTRSFSVVVQVIQCSARSFLPGQRMMCTSQFNYGSVCQFACSPGFVLTGAETNACLQQGDTANGYWSAPQPTCEAIRCPELSPPANGGFSGNTPCPTAYGSLCEIECDDGYDLTASGFLRCLALSGATAGYWDGEDARCEVESCPRAFISNNALITNRTECPATDQVPAGSTCSYACEQGHVLTGSTEVTCGPNGEWDSEFPYCEAVTCDSSELPPPENGIKNGCPHSEETYGTTCTLICNVGFMPTQPTFVTCTDDGNGIGVWDGNTVTCEEVKCDPLTVQGSTGYMSVTCTLQGIQVTEIDQQQSYGTVCITPCDLGFSGSGSGSRTCLLSGQWDGIPIQCNDVTPPTLNCPHVPDVFAGQGTSFAVVHYEWEPLPVFEASGDVIVELMSINGQPVPGNRSTVFIEGTYYLFYRAEDSSGNSNTCGFYLNVLVTKCPPLYGPLHSETTLISGQGSCDSLAVYGSVCYISCEEGYTLSISENLVASKECSKTTAFATVGFWQGPSVDCIPNTCRVTAIPNGYISGCIGEEVDYQASCTFVCDPGFRSNQTSLSQSTRSCLADGSWTGTDLTCEAVVCTGFLNLDQGIVQPSICSTESELPFNTRCTFTCNEGYSLNGPNSKTCTAQGVWNDARVISCTDHQPPVFTESCPVYIRKLAPSGMRQAVVIFPTPAATDNSGNVNVASSDTSQVSGSSFTEGTTRLKYIATDQASNTRRCDVYITVQVLRCLYLQAPASGSLVQCPSNIYGSKCTFICNAGYQLVGSDSRTCERISENAVEWSDQSPTCSPISCPALANRPGRVLRSGCLHYPPATELLGTTCHWHCPYGYGGVGTPQSTCLANSTWDVVDFTCEERSCTPLNTAEGLEISPSDCLLSPTFNDICFLRCSQSGYRVDPPSYSFIRCLGSGDWSHNSTVFSCLDYESPHFTKCPLDFTAYSVDSSLQATITWSITAADNSGETPSIVCNPVQPAVLAVGEHTINCVATDASGNQATCNFEVNVRVFRCRQLNPPFFGQFIGSCEDSLGSTCQVGCVTGYTLRGVATAKCSRNESTGVLSWTWEGQRPTCQLARCFPLPENLIPVNGGVYPSFCHGQGQPYYGTICQFYCINGFDLTGLPEHRVVTCLEDGTWDQNLFMLAVSCQDNVSPVLRVCPGSLAGSMSGQTLGVLLSFDVPMAMDNSEGELTVVKTPSDIDSPYNFTQDTVVSYSFSDATGNSVVCTFNVDIQDNLSPVILSCPGDQDIITTSRETTVTWQELEFLELTGDELEISCSHQSGALFPWGTANIQCTATNLDNGRTSMCQFAVEITPTPCSELDAPRNGAKACDEWAYGRFCSMFCQENYDVTRNVGTTFFVCGISGRWTPLQEFPDCTRKYNPGSLRMLSVLQYFSGDCSDEATQNQIKNNFIQLLNQSLFNDICTENPDKCHVGNVEVTCGSTRRRRDVSGWGDSTLGAYHGFQQVFQHNISILGDNPDKFTEQSQKWLTDMREKGKLPSDPRDSPSRYQRRHPRKIQTGRTRRRRYTMPFELTVSFRMYYDLPADPTIADNEFEDETWMGYDTLFMLTDSVVDMAVNGELVPNVTGLDIDTDPNIMTDDEPEASCPRGLVPSLDLKCVECQAGTFFDNDTMSCLSCPVGCYQDEEAQFACKTCPNGTSTIKSAIKKANDCLGICPGGHFSSTGLQQCLKCDKGSYQAIEGSIYCEQCPVGQSTAGIGSSSDDDCTDECAAGTYSSAGVQPCTPCPLHSYQPEEGKSSCHPCPAGKITQLSGAMSEGTCQTQTFCSDSSCVNGGTCVEQIDTYHCECPVGLIGTHCETNVDDCHSDSCLNGGICQDELHDFSCICGPGFEGTDCSVDIEDCINDPCENGGTCTDLINGYICTCYLGFTGMTCATNIDECHDQPCLNSGVCIDGDGEYYCNCAAGFTDDNCETAIDECKSKPCQHNGTCVDGEASYLCICVTGYAGVNCETDVDLCANSPCAGGATCQDLDDRYQCACPRGHGGVHCDLVLNLCDYNPCKNEGVCSEEATEDSGYKCECRPGLIGLHCETNLNECASEPCSNGGTCTDGINSFQCICAQGFEGPQCEGRIDLCSPNPCHHDVLCVDEGDDYFCTCPAGLSGPDCEIELDLCEDGVTCQNGGSCMLPSTDEQCHCVDGFIGEHCEINIDDCATKPCTNDAICLDGVNTFTCDCQYGFTGTLCDIQINECISAPCMNEGTCLDMVSGYQCLCTAGFDGTHCENNKNDCFPGACDHGECIDLIQSYRCICDSGYSGCTCIVDINECQSNPCANGALCRDMIDKFICECADGWVGEQCETNEDDCFNTPCKNFGLCVDGIQSYTCTCQMGFSGHDCDVNINECLSNPCQNQGNCIDGINSLICECNEGTRGTFCQINTGYCQPNPCRHGGSCTATAIGFTCQCLTGFEGVLCENNVDDCVGHLCQNGANCIDQANRYSCRCKPGYTGGRCETPLDICAAEPCQNNAECLPSGNRTHHCVCPQGFTGVRCEVTIDNCKPNPCLHGSTCISGLNTHFCLCEPGYLGYQCEQDIDECIGHQCQNDAQCIDGLNEYQCKCKRGYVGRYCNENAQCNFDMVFRCNEPSQFVTLHGAVDVTLQAFTITLWIRTETAATNAVILSYISLDNNPTIQGSELAITGPEALNIFIKGYQYSTSVSVNDNHWHHLAISWDKHGGILNIYKDGNLVQSRHNIRPGSHINSEGRFTLGELHSSTSTSSNKLHGSLSSVNLWDTALEGSVITELAETCGSAVPGNVIAAADFVDTASLGRVQVEMPSQCDVVDDCASNPCQAGSSCKDDVGHYICLCPIGFTGPLCEINIDDCGESLTLCENGGTCVDGIGNFSCECPWGISGRACEQQKVDGGFTEWSEWDDCSQSCNGGTQSHHRTCTNPQPLYGGSPCVGPVTETRQCSTGSCPSCKILTHPVKGHLGCETVGEEQDCLISCQEGYAFSRPILSAYLCGPSTNYQWSHETVNGPTVGFPKCTGYKPPSKFAMEMIFVYNNLSCDGTNVTKDNLAYQLVSNAVTTNVNSIKCVEDSSCVIKQAKVVGCSPTDYHPQRRRKPSTDDDQLRINIMLEHDVHIPDQHMLTNEQVTSHTSALAAVSELQDCATHLVNDSTAGHFAICIDSHTHDVDLEQTSTYGVPICSGGAVRVGSEDARCISCDAGSFDDGGACRDCPHGTYQPLEGSTFCPTCPRGLTTLKTGSVWIEDCIPFSPAQVIN